MSFAIFLDIDGVLNSHKTCMATPEGLYGVTDSRLRILSQVVKNMEKCGEDVKIILTSDWKLMSEESADYSYLVSRMAAYDMEISDKTVDRSYADRGEGVLNYLESHPEIEEFVIFDDNKFDYEKYNKLWESLLLTKNEVTEDEGIDEAHYASKTPSVAAILVLSDIKDATEAIFGKNK